MKKLIIGIFAITSTSVAIQSKAGDWSHPDAFIDAFGQSCKGFGHFTDAALKLNSRLVTVIRDLRDDPNCSQMAGVLDTVELLGDNLRYLDQDHDKILKTEKSQALFSAVLSHLDFSSIEGGINGDEISVKLPYGNIIETLGHSFLDLQNEKLNQTKDEYESRRKIDRITAQYIGQLRSAVQNSTECLIGHPSVPAHLIAQSVALAGAYSQSQWGGAMVAAGTLLNELTEYFRRRPFDKAIKDVNLGRLYQSISCGAEAISSQYCDAVDAKNFLKIRMDALLPRNSQGQPSLWEGVEILRVNYPKLKEWIGKIKDGVSAINREQAQRMIQIEQKHAKRKEVGHFISGEYAYFLDRISQSTDPAVIQSIIHQFAQKIVAFAMDTRLEHGDAPANPYQEQFPLQGECEFQRTTYYGLGKVPAPAAGSSCEDSLAQDLRIAWDFNNVYKNIQAIHKAVKNSVDAEKRQIIGEGADPQVLWLEASEQDVNGRQNLKTLVLLRDYFIRLTHRWQNIVNADTQGRSQYLKMQIEFAQDIIDNVLNPVIEMIRAPLDSDPNGNPLTFLEKVQFVGKALRVGPDTDYLFFRAHNFIRVDINEGIKSGEIKDQIGDLIKLAAVDRLKDLTHNTGDFVHEIYEDLANAITIGQSTLGAYLSFLQPYYADGIEHFQKLSKKAGEVIDPMNPDPLSQLRYFNAAKLCMETLGDMDIGAMGLGWGRPKKKNVEKLCSEMVYYSPIFKADPRLIAYSDLHKKPWNERVCAVHKLNQKMEIYELNNSLQTTIQAKVQALEAGRL